MRNSILSSLLIVMVLFSCNNTTNKTPAIQDTTVSEVPQQIVDTNKLEVVNPRTVEDVIMLPTAYRIDSNTELKDILNSKSWKEIYKKVGNYFVADAQYNLSEISEDPCSGSLQQSIEPINNALLLFSISKIKEGKLDTVAFTEARIKPKSPLNFTFNNQKFKLQAYGIEFYSDNGSNPKGDYTLKVFSDKFPDGYTLFHQTEYNDTCTELIMITDLDNDGLPDFILSSPRDYEEERYMIILSSDSTTYAGDRQFDC